jgi:hypothetical protein
LDDTTSRNSQDDKTAFWSERMGISPEEIEAIRQYHHERLHRQIAVTCDKCPVPMLWLDTSIFIDLAKIEAGEIAPGEPRHTLLTTLKEIVLRKVEEGKLICPQSEQGGEVERERLEQQVLNIMAMFSSDVHCISPVGVKDHLMQLGMNAYREMAGTLHIPSLPFFYGDPVQTVRKAQARGFTVRVNMRKPDEWFQRTADAKQALKTNFESIRQHNRAAGATFDERLERERVGESESMLRMLSEYYAKQSEGKAGMWDVLGVCGFFALHRYWESIGGEGLGDFALYPYMRSPYYHQLPPVDVACRLYADLTANGQAIKSGDGQDVQHLALAIPVAHFVVTDKAMEDRCRRLRIGEKWNTQIFRSGTLDQLFEKLTAL